MRKLVLVDSEYATIRQLLLKLGYRQWADGLEEALYTSENELYLEFLANWDDFGKMHLPDNKRLRDVAEHVASAVFKQSKSKLIIKCSSNSDGRAPSHAYHKVWCKIKCI